MNDVMKYHDYRKSRKKRISNDPRQLFHSISEGEGYGHHLHSYKKHRHMLEYLEWVCSTLEDCATPQREQGKEDENSPSVAEQMEAIKKQVEQIRNAGSDKGIKALEGDWSMRGMYDASWSVLCAGYWESFVPLALKEITIALKSELPTGGAEDDDAKRKQIKQCLAALSKLGRRKDRHTREFADEFVRMLDESIENHLQHM